jgi:hypothetical protein
LTGNPRASYLLMSSSLACSAMLFAFLLEPHKSGVLVTENWPEP